MAAEVLPQNGLISTITGSITNIATTIPIQSVDASNWPGSGEYRAVLWQDPNNGPWELVRVVGGQGTASLGVVRAAEAYHGDQTARAWPAGTGIAAVLTQTGLYAALASLVRTDDVVPAGGATTVVLSRTPLGVWLVFRNGVLQSLAAGHYSVSSSTITFASSFSGTDRVIVQYGAVP
jgi:hypothetical protein